MRQVRSALDAGDSSRIGGLADEPVHILAKAVSQRPAILLLAREQAGAEVDAFSALAFEYPGHVCHVFSRTSTGENARDFRLLAARKAFRSGGERLETGGQRAFCFIFFATDDPYFGHGYSTSWLSALPGALASAGGFRAAPLC